MIARSSNRWRGPRTVAGYAPRGGAGRYCAPAALIGRFRAAFNYTDT